MMRKGIIMVIKFNGDLTDLQKGIAELSREMGTELGDGGYEIAIKQENGSDIVVKMDGNKGSIVYNKNCHFFRAFGLTVEQLKKGNTSFEITEKPVFETCGPMFDVSQGNAAFNVKTLKKVIRQLSLMGLNRLMVYCEDTFEVKEQPYFGYMRAKYSEEEMRELDEYAYNLGIEMIPCIQTLAHLYDTLRWKNFNPIKDYDDCLLVDNEKTYDFLDDLIRAAVRPFRTKKINICMDEAMQLGRGQYLTENGYHEPSEIMKKHLDRVMEIIRKYDLEPMMFSDMYFRTFGTKAYWQPDTPVPDNIKQMVPEGMTVIYWDYYHLFEDIYEKLLARNLELTDKVTFLGGVWTWIGYSLAWEKTKKTTDLALDACKKYGIKDVLMSTWGDNGTECLMNTTLIGCQLYAEHCYSETIDYKKFEERFKFCTGGNVKDFEKLEYLDKTPDASGRIIRQKCNGVPTEVNDPSNCNSSKYLMWQDILTGLADKNIEGVPLSEHYTKLASELKQAIGRNGQFDGMFELSFNVANVLALKSEMGLRLTSAYKSGDRETLKKLAEIELPELSERVKKLRKVHMDNWFEIYKPLGWDIFDMRYGSLLIRIQSAIEEVKGYLDGKFEKLEELEQERLYFDGMKGPLVYMNYYGRIVSPSRIAPLA